MADRRWPMSQLTALPNCYIVRGNATLRRRRSGPARVAVDQTRDLVPRSAIKDDLLFTLDAIMIAFGYEFALPLTTD